MSSIFNSYHHTHLAKRLSSLEMESATRVQILDMAVSVSLRANVFKKGKNNFFLFLPIMNK